MIRTFKWCPERGMKACQHFFPEPHAHICIRSLEEAIVKPPCPGPAIFLAFFDGGENSPEKYRSGLFTEAQALQIAHFVKDAPAGLEMIVNCGAGVSRSPGVVLALRRHYGGDTEDLFTKCVPNIYVTSILSRVLREGGF